MMWSADQTPKRIPIIIIIADESANMTTALVES
jgi:hypothetical protein